jgi:predicted restriction endonuclease
LLAEGLARSDEEVSEFKSRIESDNYEVPDATSTVKTRGSAQKAFADNVKKNYEGRCALSGVKTPAFLIASHIVPWSVDQTIRLDPSNGICLSVLIDRAFEKGFIVIQDDETVTVDFQKIGDDTELRRQLEGYDGVKLSAPKAHPPTRRRNIGAVATHPARSLP